MTTHHPIVKKIGLLLGDENDWPTAIELLLKRLQPQVNYRQQDVNFELERIRIHPFNLRDETRYDLVIDRLAWWHTNPREWLKKVALVNDVYLLNNPFTFQSMEKHSAYAAMIRMGLKIPETWLIPPKEAPHGKHEKFAKTAERYHDMFNLEDVAEAIGYPLYMKPFDGGGWRGVSRVANARDLAKAYDESGSQIMHLQKGLENYKVFVRSLGIGPQIISLKYDPTKPMHGRYAVDHHFLDPQSGYEAKVITKIINAVFRWDFNSCEALLVDNSLYPIDFANACPDIAITSLHYYFPWAIKSLLAWSLFCAATERKMHVTMDIEKYFKIADTDYTYEEKLFEYEKLADKHFQTERFEEFKARELAELDEVMWDLVQSDDFDNIIVNTVKETFPEHEQDKFIAHFRGLMQHWIDSETPA